MKFHGQFWRNPPSFSTPNRLGPSFGHSLTADPTMGRMAPAVHLALPSAAVPFMFISNPTAADAHEL